LPRASSHPSSIGDSDGPRLSLGVDIGLIAGEGPGDRYGEPISSSMENIISFDEALAFNGGCSASALPAMAEPRLGFCDGDCIPSSWREPGVNEFRSWNLLLNLIESIFTCLLRSILAISSGWRSCKSSQHVHF